MYRDKRFDLASDHSSMMKVAYSSTEIESKTTFATVRIEIKIPTGRPTKNPVGITTQGRNIEKTAPELYIARTLFGETDFKLDLSIFNPSTRITFSKLDAIGRFNLVIVDCPKK